MAESGKLAVVLLEEAMKTYELEPDMLKLTTFNEPDAAMMQNANNVIWKSVEQHAPVKTGWDATGEEEEIIQETYPCFLSEPKYDLVQQRADNLRYDKYWIDRAKVSGRQQAINLNKSIASAMATQGSMFYRSSATNGFDFIGEGQVLQNERQLIDNQRCFGINDRDLFTYASELSGRETVRGRPEDAWAKGQIGSGVANYELFTANYMPTLTGGASPDTTVNGTISEKPEGGSVDEDAGTVTNIDYRSADITVVATTSYNAGDKIKFTNTATDVYALGLADKTNTLQPMTFTIKEVVDSTTLKISPKPIAADDSSLSDTEAAYANINTQILTGATVVRLNTDATNRVNLFWDKKAVEVTGGTIPAEKFSQFDGMKVMHDTLSNGLEMYIVYDANMITMQFRFRIFLWYGITIANPSNVGVALTYTA